MTRIPTDPEQIRQLAVVMAENGLIEVELADKDTRIRVVRSSASVGTAAQPAAPPPIMVSEAVSRQATIPGSDGGVSHPGSVTSPMVGVASLAPEPGAPNFVSTGQQVAIDWSNVDVHRLSDAA